MKLIDAHVHVFDMLKGFSGRGELRPIGNGQGQWTNGTIVNMIPKGSGDTNFTAESYIRLMHENNIEKAVILQGSFYGFDNWYVNEVSKKYPDTFVAAGTFDPFANQADAIYERLTHEMMFKILKFETSSGVGFMSYHNIYDIETVFAPIAEKMCKNKQIMVFDIGRPDEQSFQPEKVQAIALRYPELVVVICHLFAPHKQHKDIYLKSLQLFKLDNVFFDTAALPHNMSPEKYPYPTAAEFVRYACDIVGAEKIMWGTDVPTNLCRDSYRHLWDYLEVSGKFTSSELEMIYAKNALRVYPFKKGFASCGE